MTGEFTERPDWYDFAACQKYPTSWWYPESRGKNGGQAKAICFRCPVKADCLEFAIENEYFGIWGGMSTKERGRERGRRGIKTRRQLNNFPYIEDF